jgi:hypothetical protein
MASVGGEGGFQRSCGYVVKCVNRCWTEFPALSEGAGRESTPMGDDGVVRYDDVVCA